MSNVVKDINEKQELMIEVEKMGDYFAVVEKNK